MSFLKRLCKIQCFIGVAATFIIVAAIFALLNQPGRKHVMTLFLSGFTHSAEAQEAESLQEATADSSMVTPVEKNAARGTADNVIERAASNSTATRKVIAFLLDGIGIELTTIPQGSFRMGNFATEEEMNTAAVVEIDSFDISKTEITNAQYCAFLNAIVNGGELFISNGIVLSLDRVYGGKEFIYLKGLSDQVNQCWIAFKDNIFTIAEGKHDLPVTYVTWYGAKAFAENYGLDLPTEAEWEYAASGGKQMKYSSSDGTLSTTKANYSRLKKQPLTVGSYAPNAFGIFDMNGNVWEWCRDWYEEEYASERPSENPQGPDFGTSKIIKGGGWSSQSNALSNGYHYFFEQGFRFHNIGFRVVRYHKKNGK